VLASAALESLYCGLIVPTNADENDTAEIDAEFSRWGNSSASANNADFAVQPAERRGNLLDYVIPVGVGSCLVSYQWSPGKVVFYCNVV